jgi:predicted dehydrogenase
VRTSGEKPRRLTFEPVDQVRVALEMFADALSGRAPYAMTSEEIVQAVAVFEAACKSMATGESVSIAQAYYR